MACRMAPSGVARCGCPLSPQLSSEKIPIVARKELEHLDTFVGGPVLSINEVFDQS